jgi:hypothetical protein
VVSLRSGLRQPAKRVLGRALGVLPAGVLSRLLPRSSTFDAGSPPVLSVVPDSVKRLYIGPANSAGQGWAWARAAERLLPGVGAIDMAVVTGGDFGFPVDYAVPMGTYRWSKAWQRAQRDNVERHFTHVIAESGKRLFGDLFPGSAFDEISTMRKGGIRIALLFHGSDIRSPERHARGSEWSPYRPGLWASTPRLSVTAAANARLVAESGCPVFVSTPDLLLDVPSAAWLPVVVDVDAWTSDAAPLSSGTLPRVAHAPSQGIVKGSDLIDPILARLEAEGVLEYVRVSGVRADAMPALYSGVDVVLDQFRLGSYGVAACEAMAAGRIVVSNVSDQVRDHVVEATGISLPIIQATPADLESVLRSILTVPAGFVARAAEGPAFVGRVHDGRRSAAVLASFV